MTGLGPRHRLRRRTGSPRGVDDAEFGVVGRGARGQAQLPGCWWRGQRWGHWVRTQQEKWSGLLCPHRGDSLRLRMGEPAGPPLWPQGGLPGGGRAEKATEPQEGHGGRGKPLQTGLLCSQKRLCPPGPCSGGQKPGPIHRVGPEAKLSGQPLVNTPLLPPAATRRPATVSYTWRAQRSSGDSLGDRAGLGAWGKLGWGLGRVVMDGPTPAVCSPTSPGKVRWHHRLQPVSEVWWSKPHHMGTSSSKAAWGAVGEAGWAGQSPPGPGAFCSGFD